jgi:hypothetical protein
VMSSMSSSFLLLLRALNDIPLKPGDSTLYVLELWTAQGFTELWSFFTLSSNLRMRQ